jgi:hypothetical protein
MIRNINIIDRVKSINLTLILVSGIFYIAVFFLAAHLNVWEDELYSLNTTSKNLHYALHQSNSFELQPPVYFVLLTLWRFISGSILWARLFSVFLIFLSQVLLYNFLKKITSIKIATLFSILFLINPLTIFTALEIRLYALVLLLSLGITIQFYNVYFSNKTTLAGRILFILLAIAALFTQYYLGFLLFANSLVLIYFRKGKSFWLYLMDMIIPLILILLYLPQILSSLSLHAGSIVIPDRSFGEILSEASRLFIQTTLGRIFPFNYSVQGYWFWIFRGVVVILLLVSIKSSDIKNGFRNLSPFVLIYLPVYLFFIYLLYSFGEASVGNKYTTVMFAPVFLAMIFLFIFMIRPKTLTFWIVMLVLLNLAANFQTYHKLYKVNDYRFLANYLEENDRDNEPIFVYRNISADNLALYFNARDKIIPVPKPFSYNQGFGPECWKITEEDIIHIGEEMVKYPSFFVIVEKTNLAGFAESEKAFMELVNVNYSLLETRSFKEGILLYKYTRKNTLSIN